MRSLSGEAVPGGEVNRLLRELEELRAESAALLDGLTEAQLRWSPAPRAWSTGQILAHLRTTNRLYAPRIREALLRARDRGRMGGGRHRPSLLGGWLVGAIRSPRPVPAPRAFRPPPAPAERSWAGEIAAYHATQEELGDLLELAAGVDLNAGPAVSPVSRLIRMNLGDALHLWLAHDRRHLGQVRRLREHPGFPA